MIKGVQLLSASLKTADKLGIPLIELKFKHYIALVYDAPITEIPPEQIRELRSAFYAGMAMYQGDVMSSFDNEGEDVSNSELDLIETYTFRIMRELESFSQGLVDRVRESQDARH